MLVEELHGYGLGSYESLTCMRSPHSCYQKGFQRPYTVVQGMGRSRDYLYRNAYEESEYDLDMVANLYYAHLKLGVSPNDIGL
jgi:hypothetical protein